MSTADAALLPSRAPAPALARPGLGRLTLVELRKMVDTRAGFWLQISVAALTLLSVVLTAVTGHDADHKLSNILNNSVQPASILLPIVGILLVTSEWSQNTTLTTFALVPQRSRVITAKLLASLVLALVAFVICLGLSVLATAAVAGGVDGAWHLPGTMIVQVLAYIAISMVGGVAFGAAFLSSAPAIVFSFVLPIGWTIATNLIKALDSVGHWLDPSQTYAPLTDHLLSGTEWARLLATVGLWVVAPLAFGVWRILRSEIK